eukprot:g7044.t1
MEMMCVGSKTKAVSCAKSSGIDSDKLNACLNDSAKVKQLEEELNAADPGVRMYPTVKIGKKDESDASQDPSDLKKALCAQGVEAAC